MPTHVSQEGTRVEVPEGVAVDFGSGRVDRRLGPLIFSGPVPYDDPGNPDLEPIMIETLGEQGMVPLPQITIDAARGLGATRSVPADAVARISVAASPGEGAVALVEQGEVYTWVMPSPVANPQGSTSRSDPASGGMEFVVSIGAEAPGDPTRRSLLTSPLLAPVRVMVFRFVADQAVGAVIRYQESALPVGLVAVRAKDPADWRVGAPALLGPPRDGTRHRVLLLVHGTFSSTAGAFGQLAPTPWGAEFLAACLGRYDAVLGCDHRTLSVEPAANAVDIVAALHSLPWGAHPPVVDIIAHSRGGLVARSIVEEAAPAIGWEANIGKVILVGATNAGTELASPGNWCTFLDLHTNLALAACRALTLLPQAAPVATILSEAIALIGEFVRQIPAAGLDETLAPGLAAMVPGSETVERLGRQNSKARASAPLYHVVSSSFSPRLRAGDEQPKEFPTRLIQVLAEANVSRLMRGAENDLVVDLISMSAVRAAGANLVRDALHFGDTPQIYHTNYFSRPEVVAALARWLELPAPSRHADGGPLRRGPTFATVALPAAREGPPAAVDTNVLVMAARQASDAVLSSIRATSPSFVVLEHDLGGTDRRHVFSTVELERSLEGRGSEVASDALGMLRWDGDPTAMVDEVAAKAVAGDPLFASGMSAGQRPTRTVVLDAVGVAGVLPNAAEAVIDADIGTIAASMLSGTNAGLARRAMPSFVGGSQPSMPAAPAGMRGASTRGGATTSASLPLACEILAETSRKVASGKSLTVRVAVSVDELAASLGLSARARLSMDASRDIVVEVWPKRGFTFAEDDEPAILRPPAPHFPSLASFRMLAVDVGRGELWVIARQGKVPLATLKLNPEILDGETVTDAEHDLQAVRTVRQVQGCSPPHVLTILEQERGGAGTVFRFELDSPAIGKLNRYWSDPIQGDRNAYVESLYAKIEERWTETATQAAQFEEELRDIGGSLWTQLIPERLRRDLWEARNRLDSIFVLSEEPFIPWELLYMTEPGRPHASDGLFLAELGLVRWLYEAEAAPPSRLVVARGRARYAIPDYPVVRGMNLRPLPEAVAERAFLANRFAATPVEPTVEAVTRLLAGPATFDLLHFAGHGAAAQAAFDEARIMLAGEDTPKGYVANFLNADRVAGRSDFGGGRPIVVLNACQAGRISRKLTGLGGFARAFLQRRAGLFVGTLWSVGDAPARHFTEAFYEALIAGQGVADAARSGRSKAQASGDATWLAYAVYAHPKATLELRGIAGKSRAGNSTKP